MSIPLRVADVLAQGEPALRALSPSLPQRVFQLDWSGVPNIAPAHLAALFAAIPADWGFAELSAIMDVATLSATVAAHLRAWVEGRGQGAGARGQVSGFRFQVPAPDAQPLKSDTRNLEPDLTPESRPLEPAALPPGIHPILALAQVTDEYRSYLQSEFRAKDPTLKAALEAALDEPRFLAQDPFYQAHRPFRAGLAWDALGLDPRLARVMRARSGGAYAYQHQATAIQTLLAPIPAPVVVTTGTGSGKSEAFLLPVLQNAIADTSAFNGHPGLTAILIYPMNALANDQMERITRYLEESGWAGAVTVAQYDRSTTQPRRRELRERPPHLLLTNYMMLEYLLVRPADRDDIFANHRCRFLVLDEVHTYRGTLGTNIALLVRRLRAHLARARQDWRTSPPDDVRDRRFPSLTPVGTSATIKSIADETISAEERRRLRDEAVQVFFGKLTGALPASIQVISEALEEVPAMRFQVSGVRGQGADDAVLGMALSIEVDGVPLPEPIHLSAATVAQIAPYCAPHALASALQPPTPDLQPPTPDLWNLIPYLNRWLIRQPLSVEQIVARVQAEVPGRADAHAEAVRAEVEAALVVGAALPDGTPGALRLRAHRFIRGGWQFHRCLNPACGRLYPMGETACATCGHPTAPLYLCRSCGAHYLRFVGDDPTDPTAGPLRPSASTSGGHEWMLYDPARFADGGDETDEEAEEAEEAVSSATRGKRKQPKQLKHRQVEHGSFDPRHLCFSREVGDFTLPVILSPARTLCLCCGATLGSRNVITPVALGTSAAVKVMAEGMVTALAAAHQGDTTHDGKERLLVFSDSRQDAAHQARFITFASRYDRMRRRVVRLLGAGEALPFRQMVESLAAEARAHHDSPLTEALSPDQWTSDEQRRQIQAYEEAPLLDELALNAGYRATIFNLGLTRVVYEGLERYVQERGGAIAEQLGIDHANLRYLSRCVLDEVRVRGCLSRELLRYDSRNLRFPGYLRAAEWERRVKSPQGYPLDSQEQPLLYAEHSDIPSGIKLHNVWRKPKAGGREPSLERIATRLVLALGGQELTSAQMQGVLAFLTPVYLVPVELHGAATSAKLLQVNADVVYLQLVADHERLRCQVCALPMPGAQLGQPCPHCHGRLVAWPAAAVDAHRTVRRIRAADVVPLVAAEHTAQVPTSDRATSEVAFKARPEVAPLNLLACSPTLEMGIDVGGLDAVILRNVPPRPDNYAQRGGRAGRRTRVGLVLSYARNTPHDQYFYDKPTEMIAGEVPAPALALGNRDVILRHLNAIAFGAAEPGLAGKMLAYITPQGVINQAVVDALITGVRAQIDAAVELAEAAWGADILPAAGLRSANLRASLEQLPERTQDLFNRMARQVVELRQAIERFNVDLQRGRDVIRAADLINRLLGAGRGEGEADDRSSGYPLRRFAEFGLLPGYEFPSEPATLRLHGDRHEDDPISVARRFGLAQFQPGATVYARGARWKVIGLDTASPWNPRSDAPSWLYRQCRRCTLRYHADEPACPRCRAAEPGRPLPAAAYAGFLAVRDESPILDEEDRYAVSNRVVGYPQWGTGVVGRWSAGPGWGLRLSVEEEVRWVNEGPPPGAAEAAGGAYLTETAAGYRLCPSCGRILKPPAPPTTAKGGRRQTRPAASDRDAFGHGPNCPEAGHPPRPVALVTATRAEVLRLLVPVPDGSDEVDLQRWGLSLGYALRLGMRHRYMLDGPEIEFLLEGPWSVTQGEHTFPQMALSFIDPSVGGSGYLQRVAEELHLVALRAIEHLDHPNCTSACYRCLKSYENQRYHDHLSWPRIIADVHALAETAPVVRPLEHGDIDDPGPWLEAYAAGVGSPLELRFLRLFATHAFHPQRQVPVSPDGGPAISIADFAMPEQRLAIYVDGAAFHRGANRARDAHLRERLRRGDPPWTVVELRAGDLHEGAALIARLRNAGG